MDQAALNEFQKKYQAEYTTLQTHAQKLQTLAQTKARFMAQIQESTDVANELNLIKSESDGNVYKMFGPILAKQDLSEAKSNVNKRIEFMGKQVAQVDGEILSHQTEMENAKNRMMKIQEIFSASQQGGAPQSQKA